MTKSVKFAGPVGVRFAIATITRPTSHDQHHTTNIIDCDRVCVTAGTIEHSGTSTAIASKDGWEQEFLMENSVPA